MRIAEISTLYRPTPPDGEGSVELLVSTLAEGLVRRGHDVTLYATADSRTSAVLRSPVARSYSNDPGKWDWQLYEAFQAREAFSAWRDFDLIHCHAYYFGLLFCDAAPIPSLHSVHVEPGPDYRFLAERTRNRRLVFCSAYQGRDFRELPGVHVIPHGIDVAPYAVAPADQREDYLAFLGRFIPEKGPLEAIEFARRVGVPLRLAAPPNEYWRDVLRPKLDGRLVEYVGELHGPEKAEFLARARALIYPVQRAEPFGLTLVEAMACGLPVLALNRGAVPEIVRHGETGWIGDSMSDLEAGLERVSHFDRNGIRELAVREFSAEAMVGRMERLMRQTLDEGAS